MKALSLLAGLALVFPSVAMAGDIQTEFDAMDTDRDGLVSVTEAEGQLELLRRWAEVDKNADGLLEISEFSAFEIAPAYVTDEDDDQVNIGAEISR
ncbi:MAG: EF-hand domain-containing protein [Gammaproteobacteria bacterium]|nr:EF-hand domain-containing protein [Gammaproteobacteria bacterium]MDH5801451.1 EF-hand domain-containing protein [Gammaproteobacteria bacterium]